jgi:hypothetical protein
MGAYLYLEAGAAVGAAVGAGALVAGTAVGAGGWVAAGAGALVGAGTGVAVGCAQDVSTKVRIRIMLNSVTIGLRFIVSFSSVRWLVDSLRMSHGLVFSLLDAE